MRYAGHMDKNISPYDKLLAPDFVKVNEVASRIKQELHDDFTLDDYARVMRQLVTDLAALQNAHTDGLLAACFPKLEAAFFPPAEIYQPHLHPHILATPECGTVEGFDSSDPSGTKPAL